MWITTSPLLLLAPTLVSGLVPFRNVTTGRMDAGKVSKILHYLGDHILGNLEQLQTEGIFRKAPSNAELDDLMSLLKRGDLNSPNLTSATSSSADPYLTPAAFKRTMALIPGKLFSYEAFSAFKKYMDGIPTLEKQVEESMVGREPTEIKYAKDNFVRAQTRNALNQAVATLDHDRLEILRYIFHVMKVVSQYADQNKMGVDNLLLMFVPNMVANDPSDALPRKGKGIQVKLFKKSASRSSQVGATSSITDPNAIMKNLEMAERLIRLLFQEYPEVIAESAGSADLYSSSSSSSSAR